MANRTELILAVGGAAAIAFLLAGQARFGAPAPSASGVPESSRTYLTVPPEEFESSLPPPPAPASPAMMRDLEARRDALRLHRTPRYALADADSDRSQEATIRAFNCALGTQISHDATPRLADLLATVRYDVRAISYRLKSRYQRARPFVAAKGEGCPRGDRELTDSGSYPSAKSAAGWAYALVLAEVAPERRSELMRRGQDYGQSRLVCDAEWQSDVDAGRHVAEQIVKHMQSNDDFKADVAAARQELLRPGRVAPEPKACALEERALAIR